MTPESGPVGLPGSEGRHSPTTHQRKPQTSHFWCQSVDSPPANPPPPVTWSASFLRLSYSPYVVAQMHLKWTALHLQAPPPVSCSRDPDPLLPPSFARWPSTQAQLKSHLCRSCSPKPSRRCTTTPPLRMRIRDIRMVRSPVQVVHPVREPVWDTQTLSSNESHQHEIQPTLRTKLYTQ